MGPVILEKSGFAPNLAYDRIHLGVTVQRATGKGGVKIQKNGPILPDAHIIQRPTHLGLTLESSPALSDCTLEYKLGDKETQDSTSRI